MSDARVGVAGIGNVLMGDDAFGPYVVRELQARYSFPPEVELRDLGTPGLDLTAYLEPLTALILVDTVKSTGAAGELRGYRRPDILRHAPLPRLGPHDPSLKEALLMASLAGGGPGEVLLVGVVPAGVATGVGLSAEVRAAVPSAVAAVVAELDRMGLAARAQEAPALPDIWWERPPS
jgi:hydrogenase maturation protease